MKNLGSCGIDCDSCQHKIENTCEGCYVIKGMPFWGECEWYKCSHEKGFDHCCCCETFPCDKLVEAVCGEGVSEAIDNLRQLHSTHTK